MGLIIVEICESNLLQTIDPEQLFESEYAEVSVLINECLSMCGMCRSSPFALVNGRRIRGRDVDECVDRVRKAIEEELDLLIR